MNTLIIVESPAKAKKIGQLLGKNYIVKASVGHIYELAKIDEDFEPSYES
jgi:DNA topoisomerase-1